MCALRGNGPNMMYRSRPPSAKRARARQAKASGKSVISKRVAADSCLTDVAHGGAVRTVTNEEKGRVVFPGGNQASSLERLTEVHGNVGEKIRSGLDHCS